MQIMNNIFMMVWLWFETSVEGSSYLGWRAYVSLFAFLTGRRQGENKYCMCIAIVHSDNSGRRAKVFRNSSSMLPGMVNEYNLEMRMFVLQFLSDRE